MKSWAFEGMLAAAIVLPALSGVARADDLGCSNATLKGEYAFGVTAFQMVRRRSLPASRYSTATALSPNVITQATTSQATTSRRQGGRPAPTRLIPIARAAW